MARLIAIYPVKHDGGTAQPGDAFEGDEVLIATGAAVADPSPEQEPEPEQEQETKKPASQRRSQAAA